MTTVYLIKGSSFQSGKDTIAKFIAQSYVKSPQTKVLCLRFSDKVKEWSEQMSGIKRVVVDDENYSNIVYDFTHEQKNQFLPLWNMTLGTMLQKFATEGVRDGFDELTWCKLLAMRINEEYVDSEQTIILVPDFRFDNEAAIKSMCKVGTRFVPIKITRSMNDIGDDSRDLNHSSEQELVLYPFHLHIFNDGSLEQLRLAADQIHFLHRNGISFNIANKIVCSNIY
jgi:hypothetical protein